MRRLLSLGVLAALLGAPAHAGWHADVEAEAGAGARPVLEAHAPIRIEGDAGFTAAAGVRRGAGTADDPFVIAGWNILPSEAPGLLLNHTRAHVVLEDLLVGYEPTVVTRLPRCPVRAVCVEAAVYLNDAQNVTIRRLVVPYATFGVLSFGSKEIVLEDSSFGKMSRLVGGAQGFRASSVQTAFSLNADRDVLVRNVTLMNSTAGFAVGAGSSNVTVRDSHFSSFSFAAGTLNGPVDRVTIRGNRFTQMRLEVNFGPASNVSILDNVIERTPNAIRTTHALRDSLICGNVIRNITGVSMSAINLDIVHGVTLRQNRMQGVAMPLQVHTGAGLVLEDNEFRDGARGIFGGVVLHVPATLHGNSFANLSGGVELLRAADARANWWGSESGPSGVGSGSGTALRVGSEPVAYGPWLAAAPPEPGACGSAPAPRALALPTIDVDVEARAKVGARVGVGPVEERRDIGVREERRVGVLVP